LDFYRTYRHEALGFFRLRHIISPVTASWAVFALVLIASGVLLLGVIILLMARRLLQPERMTDWKATWLLKRLSPGDLGLGFEDLKFQIKDEQTGHPLKIAGWWIPAQPASQRTMLLLHGWADAKVGAIAWAPTLHTLGWNILAIDLRAHGESGGQYSTAGFWERHDVNQVINQFRAAHPRETETLAIFGISLGAAVAVATAATRDDIAAVILESPYGDYRQAIAAHAHMQGFRGEFPRNVGVRLAEWMSGADFDAVRPRQLIGKIACPVMIIHAGEDKFILASDASALDEALRARHNDRDVLWNIPDAGHVLGLAATGPEEYERRIGAFLSAEPEITRKAQAVDVSPVDVWRLADGRDRD
jgi:pimeloyl-ACP methyl ester carboxylesterase